MTREEAIELLDDLDGAIEDNHGRDYDEAFRMAIEALSAEANSDDLIIKGAKGIQDGLYNIKDGKLFKYKARGGTVRTYEIVPSADAVDCSGFIKWILDEIMDEENWELNAVANGEIIARKLKKLGLLEVKDGCYVRTPSDDAVEVVRCRDCKWYGHIGCAIEIKDDSDRPKPDDFCSFGERRTK